MEGRAGYFIIATLLTLLYAAVTVYSGVAIWTAWPGDIRDCELFVFLAALGATSLVDVWVQALTRYSSQQDRDFQQLTTGAPSALGHGV